MLDLEKIFPTPNTHLLLFVYVFFGTLQCLNTSTDIELIAEACYTIVMIGIFPLKILLFISNRFIFQKLYLTSKTTLIEIIKADRSLNTEKVLKIANRIVYVFLSMGVVPFLIYELTTLWNYLNGTRVLLSRSTTTLMPMTSPYYEMGWLLHTVFLLQMSTTVVVDMWFVLLIYFFCVACGSLARVLNVDSKRLNEENSAYAYRLKRGLKKFHILHMKQIKYLNNLSIMYSWLAFVPLCNAAMCTCIMLLVMTKEFNWRFAPHMMPMAAEIFAYNWFGEQIITKVTILKTALLHFDWIHLQPTDKRSYYIIITYMKKDFGIKTAIGSYLSLITMTAILKVTYQTFTVLQTMDT